MTNKPNLLPTAKLLRQRAEKQLKQKPAVAHPARSIADTQRLVHELQVHQVELEMQNAELQSTRIEVETALEKYTELYDFAPVGYFSIDAKGLIQEVNLTGATLLATARTQLLKRTFLNFVTPTSRPVFQAFLKNVFARPGKQACEALMTTATDTIFWADLQASSETSSTGKCQECRLAVSNIAALKRGEEAQRSVATLAAANQEANREIARRRAAEALLIDSEKNQRALLAESQTLHAQLRHLTHQLLQAQEEERKQISRELHDEISQILTGINVQLEALAVAASTQTDDLRQSIEKTKELVIKSVEIVHRFARKLRPTLLDDLGLIPALRSFVKDLSEQKNLPIRFMAAPAVETLDNSCRTVLYRVAQEALTNVIRHAQASRAIVRIYEIAQCIRLEIHDNGQSFPSERILAAKQGGRLGLLGMRERIEMVGGRFSIKSTPGKGTTVVAEIPYALPSPAETNAPPNAGPG